MKRNEIIEVIKPKLTQKRFEHVLRVTDTAIQLADLHGASKNKSETAALFHDYAKYRPLDEMKRILVDNPFPKDLLDYHHELWHGPAAAKLIEIEYGITDKTIKNAIYYHTTGRANMTKEDMILFVADYTEPGRDIPGVQEIRDVSKKDLVKAAWMISRNTINYLMQKNNTIYPDSFYAYNDLTKRVFGGIN